MLVELDTGYVDPDGDGQNYWFGEGRLKVFNAGNILSAGDALVLSAGEITYVGATGGSLSAAPGFGLRASADGGVLDIEVSHDIVGAQGIWAFVSGGTSPEIDVQLTRGHIQATVSGIQIENRSTAPTNLVIGSEAKITSPLAITLMGAAGSHVILAGKIAGGPDQASGLTEGNDVLELHPGFGLEGVIDGNGGPVDELQLGGAGTGTFALDRFGTSFLRFTKFTKTGPSTWTLTGTNAAPIGLDIQSGTIDMAGTLTSGTFTVRDGAALGGTGTLATVDVFGRLAPGASAGTLTAIDVTFHAGSIFEVDLGSGGTDMLQADTVAIDGGTVRIVPSSAVAGRYEIVRAALGIDGAFDAIVSNSPRYAVSVDDTNTDPTKLLVDLASTGVSFASYATTPEQAVVAALLDEMGTAAPYYAQLDGMGPAAAAELMGQMAGSGFSATTGALLQQSSTLSTSSLGRIQQQANALGPVGPLGYTAFTATDDWYDGLHPSAWGRLLAGTSSIGGSIAGSAALVGGTDVELGDDWTLGLLAGMGTSATTAGNLATNSFDLSAGFYGSKEFGTLALRFGGSFTHHGISSRRRVTAPGIDETLTASYGALTAQLFAEVAQDFDLGPVDIELFGDLVYARHFSPGFTETGGAGALTVAASSSDAVDTTLGVRLSHQVAMGTRLMTIGGTVGWKHRFTATPTTYNSFAGAAPFPVAGISTAGHSLVAGADLRFDLDAQSGLDLSYTLEWGATGVAQSIAAKYARTF